MELLHIGLVSSHFFFLLRHVMQPVFERPFGVLLTADCGEIGCFRGRPRGRFATTLFGDASAPSTSGKTFISSNSSSSSSSILGATSSVGEASLTYERSKLNVGVLVVESLDVGEGCDEELMLSRACPPGGAGPKNSVAIQTDFG